VFPGDVVGWFNYIKYGLVGKHSSLELKSTRKISTDYKKEERDGMTVPSMPSSLLHNDDAFNK
jgi:hypothetical protein